MNKITATQLLRGFSEYINRVVYLGESFMIVRGSKIIAELSPPKTNSTCLDLANYIKTSNLSATERIEFEKDLNTVPEPKLEESEWES